MRDGQLDDRSLRLMHHYYEQGREQARLEEALGSVEFVRTLEVADRVLPAAPAVVADIGGGPGRYALELARRGHRVRHRDLVPLHVDQLSAAAGAGIESAVGDARALDLPDDSVDAVLLLGPLYHLVERDDRVQALREAARIGRAGAPVLVAAISRWAPRLHGYLAERLYQRYDGFGPIVRAVEQTGQLDPVMPGGFTGYCHRPAELRAEVEDAGLVVEDVVGVEGLSFALADLADRLADPVDRAVVLESAGAVESVPELLGLSPHLLAVARVAAP